MRPRTHPLAFAASKVPTKQEQYGDKMDMIRGCKAPDFQTTKKGLISSWLFPTWTQCGLPMQEAVTGRYRSSSTLMLQTCSNVSKGIHD